MLIYKLFFAIRLLLSDVCIGDKFKIILILCLTNPILLHARKNAVRYVRTTSALLYNRPYSILDPLAFPCFLLQDRYNRKPYT